MEEEEDLKVFLLVIIILNMFLCLNDDYVVGGGAVWTSYKLKEVCLIQVETTTEMVSLKLLIHGLVLRCDIASQWLTRWFGCLRYGGKLRWRKRRFQRERRKRWWWGFLQILLLKHELFNGFGAMEHMLISTWFNHQGAAEALGAILEVCYIDLTIRFV